MTIKLAELFISVVLVQLAYFVSAPIIGFARALTAQQMGDDTPAQLGFLTLNPFEHVSTLWIVLLTVLQVMFRYMPFALGRYIPVNPLNIQGRYRGLKLATVYFSDSVTALFISLLSFFSLIILHGIQAIKFLSNMVTLQNILHVNPTSSSFGLVITWFLITLFIMANLMAAFSLIINCFYFVYYTFFADSLKNNEYMDMVTLFGPILLMYIFISTVQHSVMKFVVGIAYLLAYLVGLV